MTRVTPLPRELAKLTRSLGASTVAAPRTSSQLLSNGSKSAASRVRKELEHGVVVADAPASERSISTSHRPLPHPVAVPNPARTIPLMQSFHTSPAPPARADPSTIDFAFLPSLAEAPVASDFVGRVPLLPDNFAPSRPEAIFAPEAGDGPVMASEIVVMAADPTSVNAVSALTEVEGMGPDGVELRFDFGGRDTDDGGRGDEYAGGMLRGLWNGLMDDVLGGQKKPAF